MNACTGYSERYEDALRLAANAHRDQPRKGSGIPYITHPLHVSLILMRQGFSTDVAIAGLLHDVVEDQGYSLARIEEQFGARVAEIVGALSERKTDAQGDKRSWEARKQEGLEHLRQASLEAVAVKAADTLHNARCIVLDVRREGPAVWQRFARDPATSLGYYRRVVGITRERMGCHPLVDELADAVDDLAQAVRELQVEFPAG
jgi:(p)ppGpp synthase/HD superfamily hydrolase